MKQEDLGKIDRMLSAAKATDGASLILPKWGIKLSVAEMLCVFRQAAAYRRLLPTLTPEQTTLAKGETEVERGLSSLLKKLRPH
jgi:hypothetical protein